jgi:chromosome segregation and condensation protein ScpB
VRTLSQTEIVVLACIAYYQPIAQRAVVLLQQDGE